MLNLLDVDDNIDDGDDDDDDTLYYSKVILCCSIFEKYQRCWKVSMLQNNIFIRKMNHSVCPNMS